MFEEIKTRPCIIEWIGESHILFHGCGFLPIAVVGEDVSYLTLHTTYDAAKAELVEFLDMLEWLEIEDEISMPCMSIANGGEFEVGELA